MKTAIRIIIDLICLNLVGIPILLFKLVGQPYRRGFFADDESLKYPYKNSTITSLVLYSVGLGLPALVIAAVEAVLARKTKFVCIDSNDTVKSHTVVKWLWATYKNWLFFYFGVCIEHLTVDISKYVTGRLRPHFFDVCKPVWPKINSTGYIEDYVCTGTDEMLIHKSRLSFPSGHASVSSFAMVYLILYIQVKVQLRFGHLMKPVCQMVLFIMAFGTCLSRVSDYKHHWSDVLVGAFIGVVAAFITAFYISDLFPRKRDRSEISSNATNVSLNYQTFEQSQPL